MQKKPGGTGFVDGVWRELGGTTWHRADPLAAVAIALLTACGGNSELASRSDDSGETRDAGLVPPDGEAPDGDAPDGDVPDGDVVYPPAPSFKPGDAAPCGEGTVWDQILAPTEADALAQMSTLSDRAERPLTIYRGTANVYEHAKEIDVRGDIELNGPVIARLQPGGQDIVGTGYELYVRSPETAQYFLVQQTGELNATGVSRIMPEHSSPGGVAEVDASVDVPVLGDAPPSLSFDVVATYPEPGYPFQIDLSASFERSETVTFEDLLMTRSYHDSSLDGFEPTPDGSEYVRPVPSVARIESCIPEGSGFLPGECAYIVTYQAEEYVQADALDVHGIRGFEITAALMDCYHCTRSEGFSDAYRCLEGYRSQRYPASNESN